MHPLRLWPVIHLLDCEQALANARLAQSQQVDGVFLIHMDGLDDMIPAAAAAIRNACPDLAIGANYLSLEAGEALEQSLALGLDATWADNPGVRSDGTSEAARAISRRLAQVPGHQFFGSVAFKYQRADPHPGVAAGEALALGMIPTTSGPATGQAPTREKLAGIRQAIGPHARLAVASGVDADNAITIAPLVSDILVATGIGSDFHHFDADKLARLRAACGQV